MSVRGEISTDIYRQMMDLQEKLRQSEAERIQLKEMFTVLVKTLKEEEDMRLKSLENRYHTFLEDCARRSHRNEKILRSVERVESGANALHAKTERLKLLRSHYEAYLERVISTWRQPSLPRHGPSPLPSTQEVEWSRRNRLIGDEKVEPINSNYLPSSRIGRPYSSDAIITSEYLANRLSDGEKHFRSFQRERNHSDDSYWNRMSRGIEGKGRGIYDYDKTKEDFKYLEPVGNIQSKVFRGKFEDEFPDDGMSAIKGLESALYRKLALGSRQDPTSNLFYQDGTYKENIEATPTRIWNDATNTIHNHVKARASPVRREENWFSDRSEILPCDVSSFDKGYINAPPKITREPVEIKKPEIIVGKVHPESSLNGHSFNNSPNSKGQLMESVKSDKLFKPISDATSGKKEGRFELENVISESEVRTPSPQEKWSLLKHRRTIDKLKETLSFEEAQEQNVAKGNKQSETISVEQKSVKQLGKDDETDASESLSESLRPNGDELTSSRLVVQAIDKDVKQGKGSEQPRTDEKITNELDYQENFQELPQKDDNNTNEEVYEDNEESYPESYYEQPPKSDYSRDIVSNVILEEDENEVNMQDELPEGQVQNHENLQENGGYEQSQYHVEQEDDIQNNYNDYIVGGAVELQKNGNEYQNFQPNDSDYNNGNVYQPNYSEMQPQEEYPYDNQNVNNYNTNNGLEYNAIEQYPGNADAQQYYETQHSEEHGNYGGEGIGQGDNFDNGYSQVQSYENNPDVEQYNDGNGAYQQEYNQGQNGNYYNEGEYEGYYQSQQEQNGAYSESNEQENIGYTEATAYGNVEGVDAYAEGSNNLPLRQSNLSHLLESDSESFQMEHGSAPPNEDSDFDFSMSQQQ